MKKILTLIIFILTIISGKAQTIETAEELNIRSKEFLIVSDFKNAVPLFKMAALAGSPEAQYNYGVCFQQGIIVEKNDKKAFDWFVKSSEGGYKDAQFQLALNYAMGGTIVKDDKKAFYWWLKCARQIDPECMYNVISCYKEGIGTNKRIDSMVWWAVKLASLDAPPDLKAINVQIATTRLNLARMYYAGDNVPKDAVKSYLWLLIYNEKKNDFPVAAQKKNIDLIRVLEKNLTDTEKKMAKTEAEKILKRRLVNIQQLYKQQN
ncbi:MAG: sel1 repeat family protein [Bacteroidia bacterium]|nr:sel1 repeat family protein [Bacteroidia bacterium]